MYRPKCVINLTVYRRWCLLFVDEIAFARDVITDHQHNALASVRSCFTSAAVERFRDPGSTLSSHALTTSPTLQLYCRSFCQSACEHRNSRSRQQTWQAWARDDPLEVINFYRVLLCIARTMLSRDVCPSVCPSVCLSVCHTPVFYRNGSTNHRTFFTIG